ncbi:MAG: ABC-type nitrate/sulfonate/bicarbonate transport system periplasmic component-like protein [Rhodospirillales bacterium]|nr:ABC-type nitrate/sulfonate/bicarbonate transport system periplasmic component-like protein [Rhodospirillales bacterium]
MRAPWIATAALTLVAATPVQAQPAMEESSLALPTVSITFTSALVAEDQGLYEKEGLRVKTITIQGVGAPNAVIAGSIDFTLTTASTFTRAAVHGQRLLAIANLIDRPMMEIVLRKEVADAAGYDPAQPLETRAQFLKGRTIAVDGINTNLHALLRLVALRAGLDPETDVRVTPMAATNLLSAMQTKAIDGFSSSMPWTLEPAQNGTAVVIASSPHGDIPSMIPFAYSVLVTRPETCEKRRSVCEKMGRAFVAAAAFIHDQPEATLAILKKRFPAMSDAVLAGSLDLIREATPVPPIVTRQGIENSELFNVDAGVVKREETLKSYDGLFTDAYVK